MDDHIRIGARVKTRNGMGTVIERRIDCSVELVKVDFYDAPPHRSGLVWYKARDVQVLLSNGD